METTRKIYSLNLSAYVQIRTGQKPKLYYEYSSQLGRKWYCVFDVEDIEHYINEFKNRGEASELFAFLDALDQIKNRKNAIEQTIDNL